MAPVRPPQEIKLQIPAPNIHSLKVTIVGTSPMICNQFPMKAIRQIEEKQGKTTASMKQKEARVPISEYLGSFYKTSDGLIAMPALNIKNAIVGAARFVEAKMTVLRGSIFVLGEESTGLIPVLIGGKPVEISGEPVLMPVEEQPATGVIGTDPKNPKIGMRRDVVRLAGIGSPADMRYRGQLDNWSMTFIVKFNADVVTPEIVLNLLNIAGFSSGLGEWRPEKNGANGTFEVAN